MPMVMRRVRVRRARSVARGIPRLSRQDTAVVRLEKAGVDTVPRLITTVINAGVNGLNGFTFAGSFDA